MRPSYVIEKTKKEQRTAVTSINDDASVKRRIVRQSATAHLIETYFHSGPGYEPFLIRKGWQVAQLNFLPEQGATKIIRVERHANTDEVFFLFRGNSILVAAEEGVAGLRFKAERMKAGVTYNIPAGVWHNIAMLPGDLVIIVEKDNTHRADVEYRNFTRRAQTSWTRTLSRLQKDSRSVTKKL